MVNTEINVVGIKFKNPVILPSGPFGNGRELSEYFDFSSIGAFTSKTVTPMPKEGNPPPRIINIENGILNSIGLQNPGIEQFARKDMNFLRTIQTNLIVSIGGYKTEHFVKNIELLDFEEIKAFELNLSCPNVDGEILGESPQKISEIVKNVKDITKKPIFVKFGTSNKIEKYVKAAINEGADGVTLINSPSGAKIDINTGKAVLKRVTGGMSGPIIKPLAIATVYRVRKAFKDITIIGTGGVVNYEDAIEMMMAGANLVGIGVGTMIDFDLPLKVSKGIEYFMVEKKITIDDIISAAHKGGI